MQPEPHHRWTSVIRLAIVIYFLAGLMQIRQKPGLQHDEAFLVLGAVHMRHLPHAELTLPHDPDTWVEAFGVWFPLMTARYVGAIKEYLCLPVFAAFGTRTALVRILSMLLGAIGIWGIARLVRTQLDVRVAAISALVLAISPAYVANTVFDNGTVSIFMAALGLMSVAIALYLRRSGALAAFAVGFSVGFGTWARVNFIWLAAAVFAAVVFTLRGRLLRIPRSHWLAALCGGVLGSLPLIAYQIVSHGGTWQAVGMFSSHEPLLGRLYSRLVMFSEALLADREHRAMWDGPAMIWWQRWLFPTAVAASCVAGLLGTLWARILSLSFLLFAATLFFSSLQVAEHHLVELLPLAVVMVVLAGFALAERVPQARWPLVALALVYLCCAFQWQAAALAGLKRTGGVGPWSDGLIPLAEHLEQYAGSDIKLLDWGLQDNLYVVTDGRVRGRDIYSGPVRPWMKELSAGGVFVYFAERRQMPEATNAFLGALREGAPITRRFSVAQRDGAAYAEVVEVDANTLHLGGGSSIATGDPRFAERLDGFHQIETGGWRWTKRQFAITLDSPRLARSRAARLHMQVYLPESVIQQLGPVTLAARIGDHALPPETYRQAGVFTFSRDLRPEWLQAGPNRIEFALDKAVAPRAGDNRELGIIVQSAALEAMR